MVFFHPWITFIYGVPSKSKFKDRNLQKLGFDSKVMGFFQKWFDYLNYVMLSPMVFNDESRRTMKSLYYSIVIYDVYICLLNKVSWSYACSDWVTWIIMISISNVLNSICIGLIWSLNLEWVKYENDTCFNGIYVYV